MKKPPIYLTFKLSILLLMAFSICGCKKYQGLNHVLDPDALAYIQFNTGKYFIYRDSVTNKTDSIVVTQSQLQTINTPAGNVPYTTQQYSLTLTQIAPGSTTVWLSGTTQLLDGRLQLVSADNSYNYLFRDLTTTIPSMVVEGKTYTNVSLTTNTLLSPNFGVNSILSSYYWVKNVGLIKRTETKNSVTNTYTLVRSN